MRPIFSKRKRRRARKSSPNTRGKITRLTSKPAMRPMPNFLNACRWRPRKEWRFRSKRRWRANRARRSSSVKLSTTVSSWNWKKKASSTGFTSNDPDGGNGYACYGRKYSESRRDAVVFMKVAGYQKFNRWSERQAKKQAKPGAPVVSITVKKMGPVHSRIEGLALEYAA